MSELGVNINFSRILSFLCSVGQITSTTMPNSNAFFKHVILKRNKSSHALDGSGLHTDPCTTYLLYYCYPAVSQLLGSWDKTKDLQNHSHTHKILFYYFTPAEVETSLRAMSSQTSTVFVGNRKGDTKWVIYLSQERQTNAPSSYNDGAISRCTVFLNNENSMLAASRDGHNFTLF